MHVSIPQGSEESFKERTRLLSVKIMKVSHLFMIMINVLSDAIKHRWPEAIILNDLPEDEALAIWREIL